MVVVIPEPEIISIDQLKVDGQNPNRMTDRQHKSLADSIQRYGFIVPIITNKDLLIADGEQRWIVAKSLGMAQVSVIRLPVEDVDRRLLRQVLNKLRGEHELLADAQEFERIITMGKEDDLKALLDLLDSQLERYLAEIHEPKPEDYDVPEIDKITTTIQRGDVYGLGKHRLMCGDATNKQDVCSLCNKKVDMVFTDPPYNVNLNYSEYDDKKLPNEYFAMVRTALKNIEQQMIPHASIYCMSGDKFFGETRDIFRQIFRFSQTLMWLKTATLGNADYQYNYEAILYGWKGDKHYFYGSNYELAAQQYQQTSGSDKTPHPAQRPVNLVAKFIQNSSKQGEIVLDCFGGSGSTLIACEQIGRTCYMMEIDPRYCQVIINRWEAYTGQKAEKIG
jgi:DNA modification methylase